MAGWQLALVVFSITFLLTCAEPKHTIKEIQQLAKSAHDNPSLLNVDTSDNDIQKISSMALHLFSFQKGILYHVVQYLNFKAQVFEGILYTMDVFIGKTNCPASGNEKETADCHVIQTFGQSEFYMCHFVIWTPPESTQGKVLSNSCNKLHL
ncbi:cystatin-like [Narcine bancroftii]|uniref:cystatin-like n=1 Tax=Narcine bancroftii TaxID=1343680 RepID=UPI0038315490